MAFAQVQTSTQVLGTGTTVVINVSATGLLNLVVVHIKMAATTETCDSVIDNKGNVYVLSSVLDSGTACRIYQAYGVQTTSGTTTITVGFSSNAVQKRCGADEYSGGAITNAAIFDKSSTGTGPNSNSLSVAAFSPIRTGELIVATGGLETGHSWTAGTNYTIYNGAGAVTIRSQYRLVGGASETSPFTAAVNVEPWAVISTAFLAPFVASTSNSSKFSSGSPFTTVGLF